MLRDYYEESVNQIFVQFRRREKKLGGTEVLSDYAIIDFNVVKIRSGRQTRIHLIDHL